MNGIEIIETNKTLGHEDHRNVKKPKNLTDHLLILAKKLDNSDGTMEKFFGTVLQAIIGFWNINLISIPNSIPLDLRKGFHILERAISRSVPRHITIKEAVLS